MYTSTTAAQVARAVATWMFVMAAVALWFTAPSLWQGTEPDAAIVAIVVIIAAVALWIWGTRRVRALDARNRAFLMSPDGPEALRVREQFQDRVRIAQRISIVLFLIAGAVFITLVSAVNCEPGQTGGFCGTVSAPSHATVQLSQWAALALGGLYIGTAVLGRTHERESERLDLIIEEGRRRRKGDDPFAGMSRVGWE